MVEAGLWREQLSRPLKQERWVTAAPVLPLGTCHLKPEHYTSQGEARETEAAMSPRCRELLLCPPSPSSICALAPVESVSHLENTPGWLREER